MGLKSGTAGNCITRFWCTKAIVFLEASDYKINLDSIIGSVFVAIFEIFFGSKKAFFLKRC